MKIVRLLIVVLFTVTILSVTTFAQTAASSKIGFINSYAFGDEKAGITKYNAAVNAVNAEFMPSQKELEGMSTKLEALAKEVENLRRLNVADPKAVGAKIDEAEKLQRDIKFKSEDAKVRFEKRQRVVMGPVMESIGKSLQAYAKQKGFTVIFDISKDDKGFLLAIGDEKADVTRDFMAFFNALP